MYEDDTSPSTRVHLPRLLDNEFTQLIKGLQGERLRQAFQYLDQDQDGFIQPDQFKRIILVL
jgi:Ca2+-binding EF-hand superfamily protein